jgi:hypothetical protein
MVAVLCSLALMYFDSTEKEKPNVRNSPLSVLSRDFRLDIGSISVYRVCVVPTVQGRKIVKCPVCDQWVSTLETRNRKNGDVYRRYRCANEHRFTTKERIQKIERVLIATQRKKK